MRPQDDTPPADQLCCGDSRSSTPQTEAPSVASEVSTTPSSSPQHDISDEFEIAVICALPLEYDAVSLVLDHVWDEHHQPHTHTLGRIGRHNVILVLLPGAGKASAATTTAAIRLAYPRIRFALLVGVCGGVPQAGVKEMLLGDVVVSNSIIQYGFRGQPSDRPRETLEEASFSLKLPQDVARCLQTLETARGQRCFSEKTSDFLTQLQAKAAQQHCDTKYEYPGVDRDRLFESSYRHKHQLSEYCNCNESDYGPELACDSALTASCTDLGCEEQYIVTRTRLEAESLHLPELAVHIGPVGSGNIVIESAQHRDMISQPQGIIAFEMDATSVSEEMPCVILKGVSDYSDCHKNKEWQDFAAATSASALKAFLDLFPVPPTKTKFLNDSSFSSHFSVPFERNRDFIGRESTLKRLIEKIDPTANLNKCQRTTIEGPGGVGKSQIALEAAYRIRDQHPDCSVFWVPAVDAATFENVYRQIGRQLSVKGINDNKANVKSLVKSALSARNEPWLLIVDSADDAELLFGPSKTTPLRQHLPYGKNGSILFTTRSHQVAARMDIPANNVLIAEQITRVETTAMLYTSLEAEQAHDAEATNTLLDLLADSPLAIKLASAYIRKTGVSTAKYLELYQSKDPKMIALLQKRFDDRDRYTNMRNSIATTWLISFTHILRKHNLASSYLSFISLVADTEIPTSILPAANGESKRDEAIDILKEYNLVSERAGSDSFDIHRLVRLAMRNWLKHKGQWNVWVTVVINELSRKLPVPWHKDKDLWMTYLPHAHAALEHRENTNEKMSQVHLLFEIGIALDDQGKYEMAEQLLQELLDMSEGILGKDNPSVLKIAVRLEHALRHQNKYDKAEKVSREAHSLAEKALGEDHPDTLLIANTLSMALLRKGSYEDAERLQRPTLKRLEKVLGDDDPHTIAAMNTLGLIVGGLGRIDEEAQTHRKALKKCQKVYGESHNSTLDSMLNLAGVLSRRGEYKEAETLYRQTLPLEKTKSDSENPRLLDNMLGLTDVLANQGKFEEAEQIHKETIQLQEKTLGPHNAEVFSSLNLLAFLLFSQEKYAEADRISRRALKISVDLLGGGHPETLRIRNDLTLLLHLQGKHTEAEKAHRQIFHLTEELLGKEHAATLASMNYLAFFLYSQGKHDEVVQMNRYAIKLIERVSGKKHCSGMAETPLFPSQEIQTKLDQMHRQASTLMKDVLGGENTTILASMNNLAFIFYSQGIFNSMEKMYQLGLKLLKTALGDKKVSTGENGARFVAW